MKVLASLVLTIFSFTNSFSQSKIPAMDTSPLDVSYYPDNYAYLKIQDKINEPPIARILYSRPQMKGRVIFGGLIEYGKVWRLGANEATEIEFFQNVKINNTKVKKGRYTLYAIPELNNWTIIINKDLDMWGSFKYNAQKDVLRFKVPVQIQSDSTEALAMYFDKTEQGFNLNAIWENVKVSIPISLQ
jgi:hypothetical protein